MNRNEIEALGTELDRQLEAGEMQPAPGTATHRPADAPALTEADLTAIFQGRPREEHIHTSALIRKAVAEYLSAHHPREAQTA